MPARKTYKGAIHIHTKFSDGSGKVRDVIKAAQETGLDYLIISDHDELLPEQRKFQGWHGDLLVVVGVELSACVLGRRHFLALGVDSHVPYRKEKFSEKLGHIERDGGITIIAHPSGPFRPWRGQTHFAWRRFPDEFFHGIEIWTYMHDWMDNLMFTQLREKVRRSDYHLSGPNARVLRLWDEMNLRRRMAGIGSQDNHARWVPFLNLRVFSYEYLFQRLLTHVVMEEFSRHAKDDIPRLLGAIGGGNSYFATNGIAGADGFSFTVDGDGGEHVVGEWLEGGAKALRISAPARAEVTLIRNGAVAAVETTELFEMRDPAPGAYRVEMRIGGVPWLFTNHINIGMPRAAGRLEGRE